MNAHVTPLHYSQAFDRVVYLMTIRGHLSYAVVLKYAPEGHFCAYLPVNQETWIKHSDELRLKHDITYEGIGSNAIQIPYQIANVIPIDTLNYWIGIDYMNKEQPEPKDVFARLEAIVEDLILHGIQYSAV